MKKGITVHELKTWPQYWEALESGVKTFEVRKLDRLFGVGDTLHLREWSPTAGYSGREMKKTITYLMAGGQWGLSEGNCILGIKSLLTPSADVQERAKEYADKEQGDNKEVWVFAKQAVESAYLAGASSVSGMQWVKASEKPAPIEKLRLAVKYKGQHDAIFFGVNGWTWVGICSPVKKDQWEDIYWLDESSPSSMQEENERLREILKKVAHYNDGKKPYDYHKRTDQEQAKNDSFDDWQNIRTEINEALNKQ